MMRYLATTSLFILCSTPVLANDAATLSCGPSDGEIRESTYVTLDSPGYPAAQAALEKTQDMDPFEAMIPLSSIGDFMVMTLLDITLPTIEIVCGYGMYEANQCRGIPFMPNPVTEASLTGEQLSFTAYDEDKEQTMQVVHQNRSFDRSAVTTQSPSGSSTSTWTRGADGTETFLSVASNGDEQSYTEYADCSGKGHVIEHNEQGLLFTNEFSWSPASASSFTFQYKICRHQEPDAGCNTGSL